MESVEKRVFLAATGGPEPVTLIDEVLIPGNLEVGAAPNTQYDPFISAGPDGITLALWSDYRTGGFPNQFFGIGNGTQSDVWAARIAADGSVIDDVPININHDGWNQRNAKAAWNGTHWLVVWSSEQEPYTTYIHAARLAADGTLLDAEPILIMDDRFQDQYGNPVDPEGPLDVQANNGGWVVTWTRTEPNPASPYGSDKAFYATRVGAAGNVLDPNGKLLLSAPHNDTFWLGLTWSPSGGGQFLQTHLDGNDVYLTRRNANLDILSGVARGGMRMDPYYHEIVGSPAGWMVASRHKPAGTSGAEINALLVDPAGTPAATQKVIFSSPLALDPRVGGAWDGERYVVTYTVFSGGVDRVSNRRISADGATMTDAALVHTLNNPVYNLVSIGHDAGRYSILFQDSSNGTTTDIAVINVAADNSMTSAGDVANAGRAHSSPDIASDGTNFLAVFHSFNQDEGILMGIRLDNQGQPLEAEPFTIVPDAWDPGGYEVVYFGGRYVVTFTGTGPQGRIIYGQQVSAAGQLIGTPVALTGGLGMDDAAVLGDRLILAGNSNEGSLEVSRRFARVFDVSLAPATARFEIGSGFVLGGDIAAVGGRWLATFAWKSSHNAPRRGIAYNFIDPDGTRSGVSTLVSSYPDNGTPAVVSAGEGAAEAMIVFQRWDTDPEFPGTFYFPRSAEGIVGQRIAADGTRIGGLKTLIDEPGQSAGVRATFDGSNYVLTWVDSRRHVYPRQEQPDVFAARVAIDGTVLDPGGFAVAASDRPEDSMTAVSGGGHTFFVYRQFRYEAPYASYRITTRLLDDVHPPLNAAEPVFDPGAATGQQVGMTFWERLYGVTGNDVVVRNADTGQALGRTSVSVVERVGSGGQWAYEWRNAGTPFPDGNYTATLPAGSVVDKAGNPLAEDLTLGFFVLAGDANRDRTVDIADFAILAGQFNQPGTFGQGDFDYDGTVGIADFAILASKFNTTLQPPPARPGGLPGAAAATTTAAGPFGRRVIELLDTP